MMMESRSRRKNSMRSKSGPRYILRSSSWVSTLMPQKKKKPKALNLINNMAGSIRPIIKKANLHNLYYHNNNSGDSDRDRDKEELLVAGESTLSDGKGNAEGLRVPKGFLAVYVGPELRRYVIPACYLLMPEFGELMERAAEEFGYEHQGGLTFPNCDQDDFEHILTRCLAIHTKNPKSKFKNSISFGS